MSQQLRDELLRQVTLLPEEQQARVLAFAQSLAQVPGELSIKNVFKVAGSMSQADWREMAAVIEEGCERVDQSEW